METIQTISNTEIIKLLSDHRRLEILRALMVAPATLTHLGRAMDLHPARVRYHLKLMENAGLVSLVHTQVVGNYTEKYYQATAKAFNIQVSILPQGFEEDVIISSGSHDLALELLADTLSQDKTTPLMYTLPVGSLDGLIALRQGLCQLAGCHLFDPDGGEYNTSYVRHLFPGQEMRIITLAHRQQGLLVAQGNPYGLKELPDLLREGVTFVNRKPGSGTRIWLDRRLEAMSIDTSLIRGYNVELNTHAQVAEAVRVGNADVGLAVLAAARKRDLDFVPLFEERFDLVCSNLTTSSKNLTPAFELLNSSSFRQKINNLFGYQTKESGREIFV